MQHDYYKEEKKIELKEEEEKSNKQERLSGKRKKIFKHETYPTSQMQQKLLTYKYVQNGIRSHAEFLNNFFFFLFFFLFLIFFFPSLRNVSVRAPVQQVWQQQQQQQQQSSSSSRRLARGREGSFCSGWSSLRALTGTSKSNSLIKSVFVRSCSPLH